MSQLCGFTDWNHAEDRDQEHVAGSVSCFTTIMGKNYTGDFTEDRLHSSVLFQSCSLAELPPLGQLGGTGPGSLPSPAAYWLHYNEACEWKKNSF